jgi:hypothetical protein
MSDSPNVPDTIGDRVADMARAWRELENAATTRRASMTPEEAADDEYTSEANGTLMHHIANPGAFPQYNIATGIRAVSEALQSPARIAYIQRRSKEIRAERLATRSQPVSSTTNKPGSHASTAAVFSAMEEALGRTLTPAERDEMMAWLKASAQTGTSK